MHDEDGFPLLTWANLPRRERLVLFAVSVLVLSVCIGIWILIGRAALSAL